MEEMVLTKAEGVSPQVFRPWRRFLARMFDWWLYGRLWFLVQVAVFNQNVASRPATLGGYVLATIVQILLLLLLEPIFLSRLGTTPGKWLLGLAIRHKSGRLLSHAEALERTTQVLFQGLGCAIPIYDLVRLYMSYKMCAASLRLPWDKDTDYTLRRETNWQIVWYIGAMLAVLALLFLAQGQAQLPKHRGDLTPAQFADNVNKLNGYFDWFTDYELTADGHWQKKLVQQSGVVVVGLEKPLDFELITSEGKVCEVRFADEQTAKHMITDNQRQMSLAILAFAGAQKDIHVWQVLYPSWTQVVAAPFQDFDFTWGKIEVRREVSYDGYHLSESLNMLLPEDEETPRHYQTTFVMTRR